MDGTSTYQYLVTIELDTDEDTTETELGRALERKVEELPEEDYPVTKCGVRPY